MMVYWIAEGPTLQRVAVVCTADMIRTLDTGLSLPGSQRQLKWPTDHVQVTAGEAWEAYISELTWRLVGAQVRVERLTESLKEARALAGECVS